MKKNKDRNIIHKKKFKRKPNLKPSSKPSKKIFPKNKNSEHSYIFKLLIISGFIFLLISFQILSPIIKKKFHKNSHPYLKYEKAFNITSQCHKLDPINIYNARLKNGPNEICKGKNTNNICYINPQGYYNDIFANKGGVLCSMENIILDPSKLINKNLVYHGPVDPKNKGFPILSKGFLSTKCDYNNHIPFKYDRMMYGNYFHSWDYDYDFENKNEKLEELAPGKTVLLLARNEDSPNLFHGNSEVINVLCMMYLFNLTPEDVQIVIYDGIELPQDPFSEIFKKMLSRGGGLIYVKNLKKKYKISKAINVPMNWDSSIFLYIGIPHCSSMMRTYQLYNDFVDKYMNLKPFIDNFISDNITYYYPHKTLEAKQQGIKFKKW